MKYLLQRGASADVENFSGIHPLQSALKRNYKDIVGELYPKTQLDLPFISASDWRRCANIEEPFVIIMHENKDEGDQERDIMVQETSDFWHGNVADWKLPLFEGSGICNYTPDFMIPGCLNEKRML